MDKKNSFCFFNRLDNKLFAWTNNMLSTIIISLIEKAGYEFLDLKNLIFKLFSPKNII